MGSILGQRWQVEAMRAIVGEGPSDMDLVRFLHMAKNDIQAAVNLFYDAPTHIATSPPAPPPPPSSSHAQAASPTARMQTSPHQVAEEVMHEHRITIADEATAFDVDARIERSDEACVLREDAASRAIDLAGEDSDIELVEVVAGPNRRSAAAQQQSLPLQRSAKRIKRGHELTNGEHKHGRAAEHPGWLLGEARITAYATSKGKLLQYGDEVEFRFAHKAKQCGNEAQAQPANFWKKLGRGRPAAGTATGLEIVRFARKSDGCEVGRIPKEWASCLGPLAADGFITVTAVCLYAPEFLSYTDSIVLSVKITVLPSLFDSCDAKRKSDDKLQGVTSLMADTTDSPFASLLRSMQLPPIKKAAFTPDDFYKRKRSLELEGMLPGSSTTKEKALLLPPVKRSVAPHPGSQPAPMDLTSSLAEEDVGPDGSFSDATVTKFVGLAENADLPEMEPENMVSQLRTYQKQALHWMYSSEQIGEEEKSLHPCWEIYQFKDGTEFYHNCFSGDVTFKFPSAASKTRGGILADSMGLGKTVMTTSLIAKDAGKQERGKWIEYETQGPDGLVKLRIMRGGTLVVCPMSLLAQWREELDTHCTKGFFNAHVYYGGDRNREKHSLASYDVVITTYNILSTELNGDGTRETSPLLNLHWHRIVLDEAHFIKSSTTQMAKAAYLMHADRRWCLTGTPIQNNLQDIYSLLKFLRVEPWGNFGWWNKLIQRPYDDGDQRSLALLQAILRPLMLRRTKESTDKFGNPILVLPPADIQIKEIKMADAERDFYDALFSRSKTTFDSFVQSGKVLHNYANILELLLRLRQCCDHPFLVMSRGDTNEFKDFDKLAARQVLIGHDTGGPSDQFVKNVVDELKTGELTKRECPICLEAVDDAVLTPCAHTMCRECLFHAWSSMGVTGCPVCRRVMGRSDLVTVPTQSRFRLDVEKNWQNSAKVTALLEELHSLRAQGVKSVVFSQFTAFLDLLEIPLKRQHFNFVRLDGTSSQVQRVKTLEAFSSDPSVTVFLISLKAGGVGLNLTAASHAFLLDPWWNPAVEEQAIMRIHRIGQKQKVFVKRYIVKDTVEDRMLAVQSRKQHMVQGALNSTADDGKSARIEELKMLFR
eukprot:jgi/Chlat1/1961/Chrsp158S02270